MSKQIEYKVVRYKVPPEDSFTREKWLEAVDNIITATLNEHAVDGWRFHESGFGLNSTNILLFYRDKDAN